GLDGRIDLGNVAQHARPERNLVERHAVAPHGGLSLGGTDDIIPCVLVEPDAGLAHEFVQVLEFLTAGAEFNIARWPNRRAVIHVLRSLVSFYSSVPRVGIALPKAPASASSAMRRSS